jgi:hypothetical protein
MLQSRTPLQDFCIFSNYLLKVGVHLPSSDGRHGSDGSEFIITYIVSNAPALTCPHRLYRSSAMPTGIPERGS